MPNKLSQFWRELKRRNVVRVITVYAASAFVVLELVDILAPSLGLPAWTLNLVLILLIVGFIIAIILSWIYDIHPEEGIVKTKSAQKFKSEDIPKSSNSWKIASYISFVVIVGLIVLNVIPRSGREKVSDILDKSIAVLPFTNLSTDEENTYFIDGVMESILDNLCRIEDLRVPGRTSVMQYRENPKPISIVAEEMDVSYVLEGSGQKIGNRLLLTVQLIVGNEDDHIWSKQYDRVIEKVEDLIDLQKEIAQLVAGEIQAIISPEEKQRIEKLPTSNLMAYDFYTQGREKLFDYWTGGGLPALERAEHLFRVALEQDSAYAEVYTGLAFVYWHKNYNQDYVAEVFLDSIPILVNKALHYDNECSEAYSLLGLYYDEMGEFQKADEAFDHAIRLNPNDWMAYRFKGRMYFDIDLVENISNLLQAAQYNRGPIFPGLLRTIGNSFATAGYFDLGMEYLNQALEFDGDSAAFLMTLGGFEFTKGNYDGAIKAKLKVLELDPDRVGAINDLGYGYSFAGRFEESVDYYERWLSGRSDLSNPDYESLHRIGYAYHKIGMEEEGEKFITYRFDNCKLLIDLDRQVAKRLYPYYDLAAIYAFRGERDSAYANLRIFNQRETMRLWMVSLINDDPFFDSIRDESEFQQILRDVEAKYQAEHERVRQWLEENDML